MKKYRIPMLTVMLLCTILIGLAVQAEEEQGKNSGEGLITLTFPDSPEVQKITSLWLRVDVHTESEEVKVEFADRENTIQKAEYDPKTCVLNIYIAGKEPLLSGKDRTLTIGNVLVKEEDGTFGSDVRVAGDSLRIMQVVNDLDAPIEFSPAVLAETELNGDIVVKPEDGLDWQEQQGGSSSSPSGSKPSDQQGGSNDTTTDPGDGTDPSGPGEADDPTGQGPNTGSGDTGAGQGPQEQGTLPPAGQSSFQTKEEARQALQGRLNELDQYLSSDYTPETWNPLNELMQQARQLLGSEDADQAQIEDLFRQIDQKQRELKKTGAAGGQSGSGNTQNSARPGQSGTNRGPIVQTGDQNNIVLWIVLAVAALGAVIGVVIWRKKRK